VLALGINSPKGGLSFTEEKRVDVFDEPIEETDKLMRVSIRCKEFSKACGQDTPIAIIASALEQVDEQLDQGRETSLILWRHL
jgi:hypothetical protein